MVGILKKCCDMADLLLVYRMDAFAISFSIYLYCFSDKWNISNLVIISILSYFFQLFNVNLNINNYMSKTEYLFGGVIIHSFIQIV